MKTGRIAKLKSYLNAKWYQGRMLKWHLADANGHSVLCDRCGNIANGVMLIQGSQGPYFIPLCHPHFRETFPQATHVPAVLEYFKPARKPKPPLVVGDKVRWRHYAEMGLMQGEIVAFKSNGLIRVTAGNGFAEIPAGMVQAV